MEEVELGLHQSGACSTNPQDLSEAECIVKLKETGCLSCGNPSVQQAPGPVFGSVGKAML